MPLVPRHPCSVHARYCVVVTELGSPEPAEAGPVYVAGEMDAAGAELLRAMRGKVRLASPAQSLRRAGYLAEIGWEHLRAGADDPSRLAPIYGGAAAPGSAA